MKHEYFGFISDSSKFYGVKKSSLWLILLLLLIINCAFFYFLLFTVSFASNDKSNKQYDNCLTVANELWENGISNYDIEEISFKFKENMSSLNIDGGLKNYTDKYEEILVTLKEFNYPISLKDNTVSFKINSDFKINVLFENNTATVTRKTSLTFQSILIYSILLGAFFTFGAFTVTCRYFDFDYYLKTKNNTFVKKGD